VDRKFIEEYANAAQKLAQSVRGLTRDDMLAAPPAGDPKIGRWTIHQVVLHLADCEGVHSDRIKRVISEENSTLLAFDENKWAAALHYSEQSAEEIDNEVRRILQTAYSRAKNLLLENREKLDQLIKVLLEQETLDRVAFEEVMRGSAPVASNGSYPEGPKPIAPPA